MEPVFIYTLIFTDELISYIMVTIIFLCSAKIVHINKLKLYQLKKNSVFIYLFIYIKHVVCLSTGNIVRAAASPSDQSE